jgi:PEP-CTERM/exosortase A-associated glycosyltransferase
MRILHVLDHSVPLHSGYAFRTLAILEQQRALGWETAHVTSAKHAVAAACEEVVDGFHFYRVLPARGRLARLPVLEQLVVITGLYRRLGQIIDSVRPDVVHAHSPSLNGVAALRAARRFGLPVVYEVRALWEDGAVDHGRSRAGGLRYRAGRMLETYVLRRAEAVTTICEGLRREILGRRGIPEKRVTVIPNAVNVTRFTAHSERDPELARRLGLDGAYVVGFIGSFFAYEGLSVLLRAVPAIARRAPNVRVLLVGGGDEEEALKREARELGIADRVVFAGRVPHDQISTYYRLVDLLVYPRKASRLTELVTPLKPLEAMAEGRLVIASDVGGHRELIRHGETGLLFPPGNADALAATALAIMSDHERRRAIQAAARRWVESERTWAASVGRYAAVYTELVTGARASVQRVAREPAHRRSGSAGILR